MPAGSAKNHHDRIIIPSDLADLENLQVVSCKNYRLDLVNLQNRFLECFEVTVYRFSQPGSMALYLQSRKLQMLLLLLDFLQKLGVHKI